MDKMIDSCKFTAESLNENKYFIGFSMILLNIGARFIIDELDDDLRKVVSAKMVRRFFIFCSFFMATKDVVRALILTIIFVIIISEVFGKDETKEDPKEKKGGSTFNKGEIEKTIAQLKQVQATM
jgi:putative Mn2+ efflux pump MntP